MRVDKSRLIEELRRLMDLSPYVDKVRPIVDEVKAHGDGALFRLTRELDGVEIRSIEVPRSELEALSSNVPGDVRAALDVSMESVRRLNERLRPLDVVDEFQGIRRIVKWIPLRSIGIYVPRGYFSTLIMTGTLAKIAGVGEVIVTTPPRRDGSIDPETAYIALRLGARVFRIGGAQAIAAMAYGTRSVPKVDKIVGPGNAYVQAAKLLVSQWVGIDGVEGPTELFSCADPSINPELVAYDLAAQLEHVAAVGVLASWSEQYLNAVEARLMGLTKSEYYTVLVDGPRECVELVNEVSPEHATLWGESARYVDALRNAGAISVNMPSAAVDYVAGPSHVLPTGGSARWRGTLTPLDFMKPIATVEATNPQGASILLRQGALLAFREGFRIHGESIETWLKGVAQNP